MKRVAQKYTDIVLVGRGIVIEHIKSVLSNQNKLTFKHYTDKSHRFITPNTMVIGGEKVSAKRFLIVLQAYKKAHSFSVIGDKPLLNSYDEDTEDVLKSTCIIGSDTRAVEQCLRFAIPGSHTTLLAEAPLLEEYDMTVQDVIERHIKKQGVDIVTNTAILSIEPSGNYVHTTLAEDGKPRRISSDRIVIVPERFYSYDLGLGNLSDDDIEETTHDAVSKVAKNTLLIKNTPALELSVVYKAVDFLNGRSDVDFSTTRRRIYSTDKLTFFSLGIVEQDYFSTHVSYIKSICKVTGDTPASVRGFLKVLTSNRKKIIGIHAVLPFRYDNLDLLIDLVEQGRNIADLQNSCLIDDPLSSSYVEIINDIA